MQIGQVRKILLPLGWTIPTMKTYNTCSVVGTKLSTLYSEVKKY